MTSCVPPTCARDCRLSSRTRGPPSLLRPRLAEDRGTGPPSALRRLTTHAGLGGYASDVDALRPFLFYHYPVLPREHGVSPVSWSTSEDYLPCSRRGGHLKSVISGLLPSATTHGDDRPRDRAASDCARPGSTIPRYRISALPGALVFSTPSSYTQKDR